MMPTSHSVAPFTSALPFPLRPQTSGFRPSLPESPHMSPSSRTQRTPTEVLADNANDRPDISSIAVLGYN